MYLTSSAEEPFKPPVLTFRAVSSDGVSWRLDPQDPLMRPAGTPFVSIETPSVVRFRGMYHMYYSGIMPPGKVPIMAIGHATSEDGVSWRTDTQPVLSATGALEDWDGFLVGEPGAVVYNEKILLYFSAVGARAGGDPPQSQTIGVATSDDGVSFSRPRIALAQSPTYPPEQGFVGYSTPAALVANGGIHLFYDVAHYRRGRNPEWQQVALNHAVSRDGGLTFHQDPAPLFARTDFTWTQGEILAPCVLLDGDRVLMWFGGHVPNAELGPLILRGFKGREFGIGMAVADAAWLDRQ
jgi:sucrose-6-phosphate hydrolase SacC (GH32 family)